MLRRLPRNFASERLYPDGPKTGELTKQRPDALAPGGIRPGSGSKIAAEEMNDVLAHCMAHIRNTRWNFLEDWREVSASPGGYIGGVARRKTGYTLIVGESAIPYNKWSPLGGFVAEASPGSWTTAVSGAVVRDHGFVYVLGFDGSSNQHGSRVSTTATHAITSSMASSGNGGNMFAVWDEENTAIVVANTNATDGTSLGYLDTLDLVDATSGGTDANHYPNRRIALAAGAGIAMALAISGANNFCKISADGGDTWTAATSPVSGDADDVLYGLGYVDDLSGVGACFIAHVYDGANNGHVIKYSINNGASWTTIATISELNAAGFIATSNPLDVGRSFFLGDCVIFFSAPSTDTEGHRGIRVYDLGEKQGFCVGGNFGAGGEWNIGTVPLVWFDGVRFFVQEVGGSAPIYASGPIGIPPTQFGDNTISRFL